MSRPPKRLDRRSTSRRVRGATDPDCPFREQQVKVIVDKVMHARGRVAA
jgi:hypothetical protein